MKADIKKWSRECLPCQTSKVTRHRERNRRVPHNTPLPHPHPRRRSGPPSLPPRTVDDKDSTHDGLQPRSQQHHRKATPIRSHGGSWRKELSWVLLDLRTSPDAAFDASPAEALYGQALMLLADTFQDPPSPTSPFDIPKALEWIMPAKMTYDTTKKVYVSNEVQNVKYAFIRVDAHRALLSPAYSGPYRIQTRNKAYQMTVDGRTVWVSIDRLKPAYLPATEMQP
ncbi:uncharacterized protein [Macrobrachium rosenbergii]|uniref:uncharacterized protein n=1 Tax=Macrobrachium rosenbergii TaxID=79674 RepID=UPI0034D7177E